MISTSSLLPVEAKIEEVGKEKAKSVAEEIAKLMSEHGDGFVEVQASDAIESRILSGYSRYYVCRDADGMIAGVVEFHVGERRIRGLVVHRGFRKMGIGESLIKRVLADAGDDYVEAWVRKRNTAGLIMFLRCGFIPERIGERSVLLRREMEDV